MAAEPSKTDPPKRKRRWFRFRLRSLLIFTLIVAIPCTWLGRRIERKRIERREVEAIQQLGGEVSCFNRNGTVSRLLKGRFDRLPRAGWFV